MPPVGAFPVNVAVPVDDRPPLTRAGLIASEARVGAWTVSGAVLVTLLYVAEMLNVTEVVIALVATVNVVVALPAGTVMLAGTLAAVLPLARDTTIPPAGAGIVNVTVTTAATPPTTVLGATLTEPRAGAAATVNEAVFDTLL